MGNYQCELLINRMHNMNKLYRRIHKYILYSFSLLNNDFFMVSEVNFALF